MRKREREREKEREREREREGNKIMLGLGLYIYIYACVINGRAGRVGTRPKSCQIKETKIKFLYSNIKIINLKNP